MREFLAIVAFVVAVDMVIDLLTPWPLMAPSTQEALSASSSGERVICHLILCALIALLVRWSAPIVFAWARSL